MKSKRLLALVLSLVLLLGMLSGCNKTPNNKPSDLPSDKPSNSEPNKSEPGNNGPLKGGTLIVSHKENPGSFNPLWKTDDYASNLNQNIFNKLVTINNNYEICPDLAKDWTISDDGLTYTFNLHENIKWHDGVEFTSNDVKWSIEAVQKNNGRMKNEWGAIETVECPDKNTVVLKLSRPDAALLGFLAWYANQIMPAHIYEGTDWTTNPANQKPIGTGPFKFVEWKQGVSVELARNEDYFMGAPALERVIFKIIPDETTAFQAFLNGEVDVLGTSIPVSELPNVKNNSEYNYAEYRTPSTYYIGYNFNKDYLAKDVRVRQAIAMCVNRDEMVKRAFNGNASPALSYYPSLISWASNSTDTVPSYNIEQANKLLDEAGWTKGADGIRKKLDMVVFQGQTITDMCTILQEELKKVGIDLNIVQLEMAAWTPRVRQDKNFDLAITNGFQGPDPHNMVSRFSTNGGNKIMGDYSNPELDSLLEQGVLESNQAKRGELYKAAQKVMSQDIPITPIVELMSNKLWGKYLDGHPNSEEGLAAGLSFSSFALTRFNDPKFIK